MLILLGRGLGSFCFGSFNVVSLSLFMDSHRFGLNVSCLGMSCLSMSFLFLMMRCFNDWFCLLVMNFQGGFIMMSFLFRTIVMSFCR